MSAGEPTVRKKWPLWLKIVVAVVAIYFALVGLRMYFSWRFDDPLPPDLASISELQVQTQDGRQTTLGKVIKPGIPTVISLWASWCGPCVMEAPDVSKLRSEFSPDKLNVVYLNVREYGERSDDLDDFIGSMNLSSVGYSVLISDDDLHRLTNDVARSIPRTMVFDRDGHPLATIIGYKPLAFGRVAGLVTD